MAATPSIDLSGWFDEQLAGASPDLLRLHFLVKSRLTAVENTEPEEVTLTTITA